jgi:hypothetical protein
MLKRKRCKCADVIDRGHCKFVVGINGCRTWPFRIGSPQ